MTEVESGDVTLCESEERSTSASATPISSPSCARAGGVKAAREGKLPDLVAVRTSAATSLPHHPLRRPQHARRDAEAGRARGYAYMAITRPLGQPRLGDHVTAERLWERIEESASEQGKRGFRLLAGSEVNIASTARSTTPTTCSRRSTGSWPASTPRSGGERR